MTVREIFDMLSGYDEKTKKPNCSTQFTIGKYYEETGDYDDPVILDTGKPAITLNRRDEFIECDFIFKSQFDQDLRAVFNHLDLFMKKKDEFLDTDFEEGSAVIPFFIVTLYSTHGRDCVVTLENPVFYCLTSLKPGTPPNTIAILFKAEDVLAQLGDGEDMIEKEMKKLEEEKAKELRNEEYYARVAEAKKIEEEETKKRLEENDKKE